MSSPSYPTQILLTPSRPTRTGPTRIGPTRSRPAQGRPAPRGRVSAVATETQPAARLRLTRRGRLSLTTLVALPLVVAAGAFALNGGTAVASGEASWQTFEYVQVVGGQSLWQLAESIAPEADPRDVVSDLVHLNQLSSADVQPGQQLAVPAHYSE